MTKTKIIFSIALTVIFLSFQVLSAGAAPAAQEQTPPTGTIESITIGTNPDTSEDAVIVTFTDAEGTMQTVYLSIEEATALGLVDGGEGDDLIVNEDAVGTPYNYDPTTLLGSEEETTVEGKQHPVGSALSDFFSGLLGVDYDTVMTYHDDGVGFGTIAQALWMTNALDGDTSTFALILDAKKSKDYSLITLPDGSTPTNWGQFRQAVMKDKEQAKENLGFVKSGRAGNQETGPQETKGNKPNKENGNSNKIKDADEDGSSFFEGSNNNGNTLNNDLNSNNGKNDKAKDKGSDKGNDKNNGKGKDK